MIDLTITEKQILQAMADGKRPKQIALERGTSIRTVATQLSTIYRKLDALTRTQAVAIAMRRGWIH